jgi:23S rRNA (adenine2503-C2)-methyltransferase
MVKIETSSKRLLNIQFRLLEGSDPVNPSRLRQDDKLHKIMTSTQPNIYGLNREELVEVLQDFKGPDFHATQIFAWLYARRCYDPQSWSDLPKALRAELASRVTVRLGRISNHVTSNDNTVKYRIKLSGGGAVEAVYMPRTDRPTLCISSQAGCALACEFCLTGKMGLTRNLTPGEIVGQVALILQAQRIMDERFRIVFMGMGEPLHNYDSVLAACRLLTSEKGFGMSRKSITISTAGMAPAIEKLALDPLRPRLAVSLNATTDRVRDRLMPINRKYPIRRLLKACRSFTETGRERFTFEYVLLNKVNDSDQDVERLAKIVRGIRSKVNLIPFNPVPGKLNFEPPPPARVQAIRDKLLQLGAPVSIRWSAGADARAGCGQLAIEPEESTK